MKKVMQNLIFNSALVSFPLFFFENLGKSKNSEKSFSLWHCITT